MLHFMQVKIFLPKNQLQINSEEILNYNLFKERANKMGQAIETFVKTIDKTDEKSAKQMEAITALRTLAQTQKKLWVSGIEQGIGQNMKKMYADILIETHFETIIGIKKQDDVGQAVKKIVQGFTNDSIAKGITTAISAVASKMIQTTGSGEVSKQGYKVILGPLGSVGRLDYFMYQYTFTNLGLEATHQSVFMYAYVLSAVDVKKVENVNAFKVLIDASYKDAMVLTERKAILDEIYRGLDRAMGENKQK